MTTTAKLHLVAKQPITIPFDEAKIKAQLVTRRAQLLATAVRLVNEGKDREGNKRGDRIRLASDLSGIPRQLIEAEAGR